jgi:uncharacterized protein (TIGR02246 family)
MPNGTERDRAAIAHVTAQLLAAVNAADVEESLTVWADDGVMMPPHHPPVDGAKAIRDHFRRVFSRARVTFTFTSSQIEVAGDIAIERVTYVVRIQPVGAASETDDAGKGVHVYRRQPDGSWKLALDIWNSDRANP